MVRRVEPRDEEPLIMPGPEAGEALYGPDLAAIHHAHFGDLARAAATELAGRLAAAGFDRGLVVDLAAGSGILCRHLVDAGYQALGVDLSPAMLHIARSLVPEATFVESSLWSATLPTSDVVAVSAVGEALSYAADAAAGLESLGELLSSVHRALVPGGLFLFDVAGPGRSGPAGSRERCWSHGDVFLRLREREDRENHRLTREITTFVPFGRLYRRADETHRLVLYDPERTASLLARAGFAHERLSRYHETELLPGWHGFLAWKRD